MPLSSCIIWFECKYKLFLNHSCLPSVILPPGLTSHADSPGPAFFPRMRAGFPGPARPPGPPHSPADAQPDRRKPGTFGIVLPDRRKPGTVVILMPARRKPALPDTPPKGYSRKPEIRSPHQCAIQATPGQVSVDSEAKSSGCPRRCASHMRRSHVGVDSKFWVWTCE